MTEHRDETGDAEDGRPDDPRFSSVVSMRPLPLELERRPPWNRRLRRAIHYWRYGYSHPDEDLLGVIDSVGDVLHVQIISAKAVLRGERAVRAERIHRELDAELKRSLPDFSVLLAIESRINALYPPAMAHRRRWIVCERFARIAAPVAFNTWQASGPPETEPDADTTGEGRDVGPGDGQGGAGDPGPGQGGTGGSGDGRGGTGGDGDGGPIDLEDADTQTLLSYIHTNYLLTIGREKAVRDLKRWLLMRFWLFLICLIPLLFLVWIVLWANNMPEYWGLLLGLFLIATVGRAGATTSVIRRLQTAISNNVLAGDPIIELTALRTGKNDISMALLSSSIFALLMWSFFASGIPRLVGFEGGLFPRAIAGQTVAAAETPSATPAPSVQDDADKPATARQAPSAGGPSEGDNAAPTQAADAKPTAAPPQAADAKPPAAEPPSIRPSLGARARDALATAEAQVQLREGNYRTEMAQLANATGLFNLFERARIRDRARAEIVLSTLVQDQITAFFDAGLRQARRSGDLAAAQRWQADAGESQVRRDELDHLREEIGGSLGDKPVPSIACPTGKVCNPFPSLATALQLVDESDFFKLLLWAFIAGFAERFVPDMLDRVIARTRGAEQAEVARLAVAPPPTPEGQ